MSIISVVIIIIIITYLSLRLMNELDKLFHASEFWKIKSNQNYLSSPSVYFQSLLYLNKAQSDTNLENVAM